MGGKKKEEEFVETLKEVGIAVGVVAGAAALAGWGISKLFKGGESETRKMMKAPGKDNCYISRDEFENDPSSYFRNNRK